MIYLDNSSSTIKKPLCVRYTIFKALKKYMANPGRSGHALSLSASEKVLEARMTVANHFGLDDAQNVIFTSSCTEALNLALQGTAKRNGHIIATVYEHNSVLRTLEFLKSKFHITYTLVKPDIKGQITPQAISEALKPNTYLVVTNHTSNVTGHTQNIHDIGQFCYKQGLLYLVDSAQSGGHEKINMTSDHISLLAVAGHKGFHSIQCGALLINGCKVSPIKFGGTGTNSISLKQPDDYPDGLESGTNSVVNILALKKGVEYVDSHFHLIEQKIEKLTGYLLDQLSLLPHCVVYSTNKKSGVVSFAMNGYTSTDVASYLSSCHIAVRAGLHCAPKIHEYLHTTKDGLVRVSISYFTKKYEIKILLHALKDMPKVLK